MFEPTFQAADEFLHSITCNQCKRPCDSLQFIGCKHIFCWTCVNTICDSSQSYSQCPICAMPVRIADASPAHFANQLFQHLLSLKSNLSQLEAERFDQEQLLSLFPSPNAKKRTVEEFCATQNAFAEEELSDDDEAAEKMDVAVPTDTEGAEKVVVQTDTEDGEVVVVPTDTEGAEKVVVVPTDAEKVVAVPTDTEGAEKVAVVPTDTEDGEEVVVPTDAENVVAAPADIVDNVENAIEKSVTTFDDAVLDAKLVTIPVDNFVAKVIKGETSDDPLSISTIDLGDADTSEDARAIGSGRAPSSSAIADGEVSNADLSLSTQLDGRSLFSQMGIEPKEPLPELSQLVPEFRTPKRSFFQNLPRVTFADNDFGKHSCGSSLITRRAPALPLKKRIFSSPNQSASGGETSTLWSTESEKCGSGRSIGEDSSGNSEGKGTSRTKRTPHRKRQFFLNYAMRADVGRMREALAAGEDANQRDREGFTALHHAAAIDSRLACQILVENGAIITAHGGEFCETPLHVAIRTRSTGAIEYLLERGASRRAINLKGESAMDLIKDDDELKEIFARYSNTPVQIVYLSYPSRLVFVSTTVGEKRASDGRKFFEKLGCGAQNIDNATHYVVKTDNKTAPFSEELAEATLLGLYIVSDSWMDDCVMKNKIVDEERYEIQSILLEGSNIADGSAVAARKNRLRMKPGLFRGCFFYVCLHDFRRSGYRRETILRLIRLGEGTVLNREPSSSSDTHTGTIPFHWASSHSSTEKVMDTFVVYMPGEIIPRRIMNGRGVALVTPLWLVECAVKFNIEKPDSQ